MKTIECFSLRDSLIIIQCTDGDTGTLNREVFEQWMIGNDKLLWHGYSEMTGPYIHLFTIAEFWEAHASYINTMLQDYINLPVTIPQQQEQTLFDLL